MGKIVLSENIAQVAMDYLFSQDEVEISVSKSTNAIDLIEAIQDADALIVRSTPVTKEVIQSSQTLKLIVKNGIGVDNIDIDAATDHGVLVANVRGANAYSVAEYYISSILALSRKLYKSHVELSSGNLSIEGASLTGLASKLDLNGHEVRGKQIGILGFGNIGKIVAELGEGLGMRSIAYDPYLTTTDVPLVKNINEIYESSDFIIVSLPLTKETSNLISYDQLKAMKDSAFLINAGRGGIVDEVALAHALNEEWIAGAACDVFEDEPPKKDNPLLTAKNVILTAHIAGTTDEALAAVGQNAASIALEYVNGQTPTTVVNTELLE